MNADAQQTVGVTGMTVEERERQLKTEQVWLRNRKLFSHFMTVLLAMFSVVSVSVLFVIAYDILNNGINAIFITQRDLVEDIDLVIDRTYNPDNEIGPITTTSENNIENLRALINEQYSINSDLEAAVNDQIGIVDRSREILNAKYNVDEKAEAIAAVLSSEDDVDTKIETVKSILEADNSIEDDLRRILNEQLRLKASIQPILETRENIESDLRGLIYTPPDTDSVHAAFDAQEDLVGKLTVTINTLAAQKSADDRIAACVEIFVSEGKSEEEVEAIIAVIMDGYIRNLLSDYYGIDETIAEVLLALNTYETVDERVEAILPIFAVEEDMTGPIRSLSAAQNRITQRIDKIIGALTLDEDEVDDLVAQMLLTLSSAESADQKIDAIVPYLTANRMRAIIVTQYGDVRSGSSEAYNSVKDGIRDNIKASIRENTRDDMLGIDYGFFIKERVPPGQPGRGGIAHAIMGTLMMLGTAALVSVPLGIMVAIYLVEYGTGRFAQVVRFVVDLLLQVPSIVVGIFVWTVLVSQGFHLLGFEAKFGFSGIAGAVSLMMIMTPVVVRAVEEILNLVPATLRESGLALGLPRWRVVLGVVVPTVLPGIITAVILAMARAAGESAPLLLTALGNEFITYDLSEPMTAIPLEIFKYYDQPYPELIEKAWGAALVLIIVIATVSATARIVSRRMRYES